MSEQPCPYDDLLREATRRGVETLGSCEVRQVAAGVEAAIALIAPTLEWLADLHHRTLTGSRLHDPERIERFRDCPCLSCQRVAGLLGGVAS